MNPTTSQGTISRAALTPKTESAFGDPDAEAVQQAIHAQARVALGMVLAREPGAAGYAGGADQETIEMAAEVVRAGLAGLALWWHDHPQMPRERIVRTAYNVL